MSTQTFKKLTQAGKRYASAANKGLDRDRVKGSGRKLPSERNSIRLAAMVEEAYNYLKETEKRFKDVSRIQEKRHLLNEGYKRDQERLKEVPNNYLLDQRRLTIVEELRLANELYEALQRVYKQTTGKNWKKPANINEPLEF